jgi:2-polyprenyl-6-methoxyphenol hydroxylase-like FAD-dependent oxidoreductase
LRTGQAVGHGDSVTRGGLTWLCCDGAPVDPLPASLPARRSAPAAGAGDEAYCGSPLTGLGTSASLVGAYVLAGELACTPVDHEAAFRNYQEAMRGYVAACQQLPPGGVEGFAPRSQAMIRLLNLATRLMTAWPVRHVLAKQYRKAEGITLKASAA